jgi:UDP-glucose 4-epimerase
MSDQGERTDRNVLLEKKQPAMNRKTILITGASGFIGKALARELSKRHTVICLSRKETGIGLPEEITGNFSDEKDLKKLDKYVIHVAVHLGAVTGGCKEGDGITVNVEGTRRLMRYLIDHGCRKIVLASSIAAVGLQNIKFRPVIVPIPDDHPCLDRDGYGLSKFLMEEVAKYFFRQNDHLDIIALRLALINNPEHPHDYRENREWALADITTMTLEDSVRVFTLAAESSYKPGVRIMNAVCTEAWCKYPVAVTLKNWYGRDFDTSWFETPETAYASVFDSSYIRKELGFIARDLPNRQ